MASIEAAMIGVSLSWLRVTVVFLIDVAVLVVASNWPGEPPNTMYAWWAGVGIASLVATTALISYRGVPLSSFLAPRMRDRSADPVAMSPGGLVRAVDHHRRYGRETVGIREYQGQLTSVIAVGGPAAISAGRHHHELQPTVELPVDVVAAGLRQFDLRLAAIDIVSVGTRDTVDDEPGVWNEDSAPDHRETWLMLRMDPQSNVAAVASRDSVVSMLAAATERLVQDLDGREITARVLTSDELADVDVAILGGLDPAQIRARHRAVIQQEPQLYAASFWVSPPDITSDNLARLWLPNTDTTVVTVRLTRRYSGTEVAAFVRFHSDGKLHKNVRAGLNRFTRRQLTALCASLPTPMRFPALDVPARALNDDEELAVALDPTPQQQVVRVGTQP